MESNISSDKSDNDNDNDNDNNDEDYYDYHEIIFNTTTTTTSSNNHYVHELFKYLNTDEDQLYNKTIKLVLFNIANVSPNNKFIQFMLEKKNDVLSFPTVKICENIKPQISQLLNVDASLLKYKGYITFQGNIHLFIQIDQIFTPLFMQRDQQYWFCIIDEIVNYKKVCNFQIDCGCSDFLLSNPDFYTLKNPYTLRKYELPIIAYSGNVFNLSELDANFGVSRKNEYSICGPHFYFTTYEKAVEMGGWTKKNGSLEHIKGGINRFAIFCGDHHIIYKPQSKYTIPDDSDSIYVGEMQLNPEIYNESPMWVIKSSDNFKSLSYHLLDKTTLGEKWNRDYTQYFIS